MRPIPRAHLPWLMLAFGVLAALVLSFVAGRDGRALWNRWRAGSGAELEVWDLFVESPRTRYETPIAVLNNRIYLFGGFRNAAIQASPEVWVLDPADGSWTRKADLPVTLTHINAVVVNDTVWIAGGFIGDHPGPPTRDVWRYDWRQDRWSLGPSLPAARGSGALAEMAGKLHYFGGYAEDRRIGRGEHWMLSAGDTAWVAAAPLPKPRGHVSVAVLDGRMYALGGAEIHDPVPVDVPWVHRYDAAGNAWTEMAPLPFARSHFEQSTLVRDGRIVMIGGRSLPIGRQAVSDISEYDPATDRWTSIGSLPKPIHSPSAAVIDGRLYVGYGGSRNGVPDNLDFWRERLGVPWKPVPPAPAALGEVSAAAIGDKLYVVGDGAPWTLAFDLRRGQWDEMTRFAARPAAGNHHAAEVWNGRLLLFGGMGESRATVQIYDPATDLWRLGPALPFPAGSMASAVIDSQVYLAGGVDDHGTRGELVRYDPAADTFTQLTPMPLPRNHTAAATDGKRFFVFGGRGPGSGDHNVVANGFDEVQIYDPATDRWSVSGVGDSAPARLPQARGGMGKAVYDGREFWVFGGETLDGPGANRRGVYDRVDIYDPVANRWRAGPPMPSARHGIFPVLVGDRIFVIGGGTRAGFSATTIAEALDLRPQQAAPPP